MQRREERNRGGTYLLVHQKECGVVKERHTLGKAVTMFPSNLLANQMALHSTVAQTLNAALHKHLMPHLTQLRNQSEYTDITCEESIHTQAEGSETAHKEQRNVSLQ